jgi:hypothetical protein
MRLKPELVAFSLGFGVFLSFVGSAVVAPPDPLTQLVVIPLLLVVTIPVIYHVLDVDRVASLDQKSRLPFPYLVSATIASTGAGLLVPVPVTTGWLPILVRSGAFVGAFFVVSILAVRIGPTDRDDAPAADQPDLPGREGPDSGDSGGGIPAGSGGDAAGTDGDSVDEPMPDP